MQSVPEILYEDNHVLAVTKPAGMLTQGDISGIPSLLEIMKAYIKMRDNKPGNVYLGMVQRLDRPVSGVIIFAKTSKAAGRLSAQIRDRQIGKLYVAVTSPASLVNSGLAEWCEIAHHLQRKRDITVVVKSPSRLSQDALLRMKTLGTNDQCSIHLISLVTGRKHQIRSQLAYLDLPILGDEKYGSEQSYPVAGGIGLHAVSCLFDHPVKHEQLLLRAGVPSEFYNHLSGNEKRLVTETLDSEISYFGKDDS